MNDDPDSDRWNAFGKNFEQKKRKNGFRSTFKKTDNIFESKGDLLKIFGDYNCNVKELPGVKTIKNFLEELIFDPHTRGKKTQKMFCYEPILKREKITCFWARLVSKKSNEFC